MNKHCGRARAAGFSLIELLVVITIIGALIALLLPAVQSAREAARRISCANNLHEIGQAMHSYHVVCNTLPMGGVEVRTLRLATGKLRYPNGIQMAWSAYILPYLDMQSLHAKINFGKGFDGTENAAAASFVVSTYLCPSIPRSSSLRDGRGACDYGGIYGERILSANNPPKGVMLYTKVISFRDISDGTSNTMMVAEDYYGDMQWINALNVFDVSAAVNAADENDIHSYHTRGAHGLFADGTVHFLSNDLNVNILGALCSRAGGEIVGSF